MSPILMLLQQAERPAQWVSFLPLLIIFAIFYFLVFAPARRRQKALQGTVDALKRGDRVVTTGGLHGEVASVEEKVVLLKIADGVKVKVTKSAIAGLESDADSGRGK